VGLRQMVARAAARHAHVLIVEAPGHWRTRAAAERGVRVRGWGVAGSPADADVLLVCGEPGQQVSAAIEVVWQQLPGPRVRVDVAGAGDVAACLDEAGDALLEPGRHREDSRPRLAAPDLLEDGDEGHGEMGHGDMDHGEMGHGEMGHGGMEMAPDGIPLAEGGEDRDGLEMDVLHVRLGPVLAHWPAGLALRCSLQGDVIVAADAQTLDQPTQYEDAEPVLEHARRCDNIAALLALAGWEDAAAEARGARDGLLTPPPTSPDATVARLARLHRKVNRSRLLRWSLRGICPLSSDEVAQHGLPTGAAGDTYDRLLGMLERTHREVAAGGRDRSRPAALSPDQLPPLVTGLDLGTARLVLASLDIHELRAAGPDREVTHA
jgi:hypothetical protein